MPNRYYSSIAGAMTLSGNITNADTSMIVSTVAGLPTSYPYTLVVDAGAASEEIVNVTAAAGTTLTIVRAQDGSTAQAHSLGAAVRHMITARDLREPQDHMAATQQVHGLAASSSVVGTLDTQSLTNKTALAASAGTNALVVKEAAGQTADTLVVQDSTGAAYVSVGPGGSTVRVKDTVELNTGAAAIFWGYAQKITTAGTAVIGLLIKRVAGQTGDLVQLQNESGTVLAKFDKDANLTVPSLASGAVGGTTGTFSGAVATGALGVTGDVTASGNLNGVNGTLTGNVAVTGTVSGSNLPAVPAAKAGKRMFWGSGSGTTAANGTLTVTHGAGFTPSQIFVFSADAGSNFSTAKGVDTITTTQFRTRFFEWNSGLATNAQAVTFVFLCLE